VGIRKALVATTAKVQMQEKGAEWSWRQNGRSARHTCFRNGGSRGEKRDEGGENTPKDMK
jgi:hypothetical protein